MPRELIRGPLDGFNVKVTWDRDSQYVQIASVNEQAPDLVRRILEDPDAVAVFDGLYATLDRDSLNQLIRVLRRARNAAFGADE